MLSLGFVLLAILWTVLAAAVLEATGRLVTALRVTRCARLMRSFGQDGCVNPSSHKPFWYEAWSRR